MDATEEGRTKSEVASKVLMGLLTLARLYLRLRHRAPDIENRTNTSSHTLREPHTQVTGSLVLVSAGTNQCITLLVHTL